MLWEMWYGKRAFSQDFEIKPIIHGQRPSLDVECQPEHHLKDLIQSCWDGLPKCRPSSQKCYHILRNYFNDLAMLEIDDLLPRVKGRKTSRTAASYAHRRISMASESVIYRV